MIAAHRHPLLFFMVLFLSALLLGNELAWSGEAATPSEAPEQKPPSPEAIPLAEIPPQAEAALARIRDIRDNVAADRTSENVAQRIPVLMRQIDGRMRETRSIIGQRPTIEILRTLRAEWQRLRREVSALNYDLSSRAGYLERDIEQIDRIQDVWTQTLNAARSDAPAEVVGRIREVAGEIAHVRHAVVNDRAATLTTQSRLSTQDARIVDALGLISRARDRTLSRLFTRDSLPIWRSQMRSPQDLQAQSLTSFSTQWEALGSYLQRQPGRWLLGIVIFFAFAAALTWARRHARSLAESSAGAFPESRHFETPLSAALLAAFLLSWWIFPDAPRLLWAALGTLALIPSVLIMRHVVGPQLSALLYALIAFYIVDQLRTVAAAVYSLPRWLLAAEMICSTTFLIWLMSDLLRSPRDVTAGGIRRLNLYRTAAAAALLASVLALIGNVFGYLTFANLVGNALLRSAYFAVILLALIEILTAIAGLLFTLRPFSLLRVVRRNQALLRVRVRRLLQWTAAFLWILVLLNQLLIRERLFGLIWAALTAELKIGSLGFSLGDLLGFVLTVWASFLISRFVRFLLDEDIYPRLHLKRGLPYAISNTAHYLILLVGFLLGVAALGLDMTKVTILVGAFSVGVGFGLQNIFNNFISGLILLFERPISIGDIIQIGDASGVVERIGIRASIIRTTKGSEVIVPNGQLISDRLTNWTLSNRQHGIELPVAVAREADPSRVREILERTVAAHPSVAQDPPPQALVTNLGPTAITFEVRAWTEPSNQWMQVRSELAIAVNAALTAEKISLK